MRGRNIERFYSSIGVVVVYHVTIVAIGHGLLKKFWPFGTRLSSTHCRKFNYLKLCRPAYFVRTTQLLQTALQIRSQPFSKFKNPDPYSLDFNFFLSSNTKKYISQQLKNISCITNTVLCI